MLKVVHVPNRWCGQQKEEARALALLHDNDWSPGPAMGGWWSAEYTETNINIESIRRSDDSEPYLESDPNWAGLDQYRQQHRANDYTIALCDWLILKTDRYGPNFYSVTCIICEFIVSGISYGRPAVVLKL